MITTCINNRFDQPGYKIYCTIQNLLLKAANGDDYDAELKFVTEFYGSDFDGYLLKTQLEILSTDFTSRAGSKEKYQLDDVIEMIKSKSESQQTLISEVCILLKLLLVMPATNAVSERSFSSLRIIIMHKTRIIAVIICTWKDYVLLKVMKFCLTTFNLAPTPLCVGGRGLWMNAHNICSHFNVYSTESLVIPQVSHYTYLPTLVPNTSLQIVHSSYAFMDQG